MPAARTAGIRLSIVRLCESYLHHLGGSCCTWVQLLCGILATQLEKPFEVYTVTLEVSDLNMRGRQMTMKRRALEATGSLGYSWIMYCLAQALVIAKSH